MYISESLRQEIEDDGFTLPSSWQGCVVAIIAGGIVNADHVRDILFECAGAADMNLLRVSWGNVVERLVDNHLNVNYFARTQNDRWLVEMAREAEGLWLLGAEHIRWPETATDEPTRIEMLHCIVARAQALLDGKGGKVIDLSECPEPLYEGDAIASAAFDLHDAVNGHVLGEVDRDSLVNAMIDAGLAVANASRKD